ncbi:MAG: Uma2 family endonuclease [Solirubrobacteraceae bacterium]|nr:Uma2 family endonuclease [Solirubrobacteraceae bacterium]
MQRVYEERGTGELWLVDTKAQTVLVYRRSAPQVPTFDVELELGAGDALASPQLPGFALAVDGLFAG